MKRRTARQLVHLLSDLRHSAHCRMLRAAAASAELDRVLNEQDEQAVDLEEDSRGTRQDVFAGAQHEKLQ